MLFHDGICEPPGANMIQYFPSKSKLEGTYGKTVYNQSGFGLWEAARVVVVSNLSTDVHANRFSREVEWVTITNTCQGAPNSLVVYSLVVQVR